MCDRVSPVVEFLQVVHATLAVSVVVADTVPEIEAEAIEICADVSRIRIGMIKLAVQREFGAKYGPQANRIDDSNDVINAFRMQIPTEALKLRRQQHGVRVVDLVSRVTSTASAAADTSMCVLDFVKFADTRCVPGLKGYGRHAALLSGLTWKYEDLGYHL